MCLMRYICPGLSEEVFDGANNTFVYERQMSVSFTCPFYLKMYPFDTQSCRFFYYLSNVDNVIITLVRLPSLGEEDLLGKVTSF